MLPARVVDAYESGIWNTIEVTARRLELIKSELELIDDRREFWSPLVDDKEAKRHIRRIDYLFGRFDRKIAQLEYDYRFTAAGLTLMLGKLSDRQSERQARERVEKDFSRLLDHRYSIIADSAPVVLQLLQDVGVGVLGSVAYEESRRLVRRIRLNLQDQEIYSEEHLVEKAQRKLSTEIGIAYDDLVLRSTALTPGENSITCRFTVPAGDSYTVDVAVVKQLAVMLRLEHELP